jgi:hypothetical protein
MRLGILCVLPPAIVDRVRVHVLATAPRRPFLFFSMRPGGHAVGAGDAVMASAAIGHLRCDSTTANTEQLPSWYVHLNP